jgi:hypothetical protein
MAWLVPVLRVYAEQAVLDDMIKGTLCISNNNNSNIQACVV